jgi:hypothetical protein
LGDQHPLQADRLHVVIGDWRRGGEQAFLDGLGEDARNLPFYRLGFGNGVQRKALGSGQPFEAAVLADPCGVFDGDHGGKAVRREQLVDRGRGRNRLQ